MAINNQSTSYLSSFVESKLWLLPSNSLEKSANTAGSCSSVNLLTITNKQCCAWKSFSFLEASLNFLEEGLDIG